MKSSLKPIEILQQRLKNLDNSVNSEDLLNLSNAVVSLSKFELRRPKVRDRLAVVRSKSSDAEKEVQLIANLAELPIEVIEENGSFDCAEIQQELSNFLLE